MVQRAVREKNNTQADVIVTLPPFIQQADSKGLLQAYTPKGAEQVDGANKAADGKWTSVVNNYFGFIYNKQQLRRPPRPGRSSSTARSRTSCSTPPPVSRVTARPSSSRR